MRPSDTDRCRDNPLSTNLEEIQRSFTRYLRKPLTAAKPSDIPAERIEVYQDLVFRNVQSLFAVNFPVLESITTNDDWKCLIRGFIRDHRTANPTSTNCLPNFYNN